MQRFNHFVSLIGRIFVACVFASIVLQGCVEKGGIVISPVISWCDKNTRLEDPSKRPPKAPGGCDSVWVAGGESAEGFIGVGAGPSVVPAGYQCLTGDLCDPEGADCNRAKTKHCKNHYYYSTGECACNCIPK